MMFGYINTWMGKEEKRNQVLWNSGKVGAIKSNFLKPKDYVKKFILIAIGVLIGLIALIKRLRRCIKVCTAI
jgi:hypothetical protein